MSEHSKTPWIVQGTPGDDDCIIFDCNGFIVDEFLDFETASKIVHCVNNFDGLIEALEKIQSAVGAWRKDARINANTTFDLVGDIVRNALARAKG